MVGGRAFGGGHGSGQSHELVGEVGSGKRVVERGERGGWMTDGEEPSSVLTSNVDFQHVNSKLRKTQIRNSNSRMIQIILRRTQYFILILNSLVNSVRHLKFKFEKDSRTEMKWRELHHHSLD